MIRKMILFAACLILITACSTSTLTESPTSEVQPSATALPEKERGTPIDVDSEFITAVLGGPFRLVAGQTGVLDGFDMEITFNNVVAESRCPSNVQCIWAGQVVLAMQVRQGGELIDEFELVFGALTEDDSPGWEQNGMVIMLMDVSPYPQSTEAIEQEDYIVELVVMQIDGPP